MKIISVLQTVFGLATAYFSWTLADTKTGPLHSPFSDGSAIIVNARPPGADLEIIVLCLGVAVFLCGLVQLILAGRYAVWQMVCGLAAAGTGAFFAERALSLPCGEMSSVYYVLYAVLCLGLAEAVIGILQFLKPKKKSWKQESL